MSLTSFSFFVFLLVTLVAYYSIKPLQKYILLAASVYFYLAISPLSTLQVVLLVLFMALVPYVGAILMEKSKGAVKSAVFCISVLSLVSVLFVLKYAYNILEIFKKLFGLNADFSALQFVGIIGISYYALSAIGYLIDVYWESYRAEKNPANVGLFVFYFPQVISGPVTRYADMREQFNTKFNVNFDNITDGMRRMAWGYFKKLVISERFAIAVSAVYGSYWEYSFVGILCATLCYAVQLYTDFSGCMDIIMGASMMFGIELPENFNAPFFSETVQEFWQRWHITLGNWFKDYVMYPFQKSKFIQTIGKKAKKVLGKKAGKKIPFYLAMLLLWFLIGLWHGGTPHYFVASAGIPFTLLFLSDLLQPVFVKLTQVLKVNTECASWHWFRRIRTWMLVNLIWLVVCANGIDSTGDIIVHMIKKPWAYTTFESAMTTIGLDMLDVVIMLIGLLILYIAEKCAYEKTTIFKVMDKQNAVVRIVVLYAEILMILFHGMVGSSSFIYFKF